MELGAARDPRMLGVALRRIEIRCGSRLRIMEAADLAFAGGFHAFEPAGRLRWTDGDAGLPAGLFEGFDSLVELVLDVSETSRYPLFEDQVRSVAA